MALTDFQRRVCQILAASRLDAGDSDVAGGTALNEILASPRLSRDIAEIAMLAFAGPPPDLGDLSRRWRTLLEDARETIEILPADQVGTCVLSKSGTLFTGTAADTRDALARDEIVFHRGRLKGAFPRIIA